MSGQRLVFGPYFYGGNLLTDGVLWHYATGTGANKPVYTDKALTNEAAQNLACDANGLFTFFAAGEYRFVLALANGTTISAWDQRAIGGVGEASTVLVDDYYETGETAANNTIALQAAADAAAGGVLEFTAGTTYEIIRNITVLSRTLVLGNFATLKAHDTLFVGHINTNDGYLLRNYNHGIYDIPAAVTGLTDYDIYIHDLHFIQNTYASGTGQIAIGMRYADRVQVHGCTSTGGGNFTGFLACQDTYTGGCHVENWGNAAYDHWDGAGFGTVAYCTARNTIDCAQGIQFSGAGSLGEARTSTTALVIGNRVFGVRHSVSGTASSIISNAVQATSSTYRFRSAFNYIEDGDLGVVFSGPGGQHTSYQDTLKAVDGVPLFQQAVGGTSPDKCEFIEPTLIDCNATTALINLTGTEAVVRHPRIINSGSPPYPYIVQVYSTATDAIVDISNVVAANDGSTGRILNSGTNTKIKGEAVAYTPVLAFGGASVSLTYNSRSSHYTRNGDVVFYSGQINVLSNGSSTGQPTISLPITAKAVTVNGVIPISMVGASGLTSVVYGIITTGTTMLLWDYGATGAVALAESNIPDGAIISWAGSYRVEI